MLLASDMNLFSIGILNIALVDCSVGLDVDLCVARLYSCSCLFTCCICIIIVCCSHESACFCLDCACMSVMLIRLIDIQGLFVYFRF